MLAAVTAGVAELPLPKFPEFKMLLFKRLAEPLEENNANKDVQDCEWGKLPAAVTGLKLLNC